VLQEPVSREARIHELDWATQRWRDTGIVVDERPFAHADALFADGILYVASAGGSDSPAHAVRFSKFRFDAATRHWSLEPDYPVTVAPSGVESSLIERADDGRLWVAYIQDGRLFVSHSLDDDHRWVPPYRPVVAGAEVATDQVGMVASRGDVVLLWSNQNDQAIYATSHEDGAGDDEWAPATTILQGLRLADNHVNIKALPDGRLFAAIKTSLDTVPGNQPGWDQILLLDRVDGQWSSTQVGQIRDKHTRPIVLLDTSHGEALVFATAPVGGGAIYMKRAPLDDLRFTTGEGVPVIETTPEAGINDATSTKQPVDASTGLVVLASDDSTGRYVHLAASLGGPLPGVPTGPPPDAPEAPPAEPVVLLDVPANGPTAGDPVDELWRMAPSRADGTLAYVPRDDGLAIRARTTGSGELRPCRSFGAARSGRLTMSMDVRLDRQGPSDTILLMARGDGEELAALRVDDQRRVRVSRLGNRDTTDVRLVPGRWYHVELDLDVAAHTFRARLTDSTGATLLDRKRLAWRAPAASSVETLCVAASTGAAGLGISFDTVRVTRTP
ncbi:MAG TPA: hypothetical protein VFI69_01155, partial [Candidatus Limnocylindrales bacterium]|nr:hypothetical protein [Candidatus Limnocylindrales bacterium]